MAVATHFRFRLPAPLLVATTMVAFNHAQANGADLSGSPQTYPVASMHQRPGTCDVDPTKPRPSGRLEPPALPVEPAMPVILDGVMYLENVRRSGATDVRRVAATPRCPAHPYMWEFRATHRRIDPPGYY